jgi:hypothetical protein
MLDRRHSFDLPAYGSLLHEVAFYQHYLGPTSSGRCDCLPMYTKMAQVGYSVMRLVCIYILFSVLSIQRVVNGSTATTAATTTTTTTVATTTTTTTVAPTTSSPLVPATTSMC